MNVSTLPPPPSKPTVRMCETWENGEPCLEPALPGKYRCTKHRVVVVPVLPRDLE